MVTSALGERLSKHPASMVVAHVPTAVWLLSGICDLLALITGLNRLVRFARALQLLGVVGALAHHLVRPSAPAARQSPEQHDLAHLHGWLNHALVVVFALSAGMRSGAAATRHRPAGAPVLLTVLGIAGLFLSRELAKRREPDEGGAAAPATPEFVPVARLSELAPGAMTMVEVNNHTVALANVDGQVYAFSNVCSHRDGPLAEGRLEGEWVTCPWHESSFSVKTGEVRGGPARRGVPTYGVRVEGDDILVQTPR
jgi:3-phenylpropionate/trans-cinnamate dioxygenase ferredoxin component